MKSRIKIFLFFSLVALGAINFFSGCNSSRLIDVWKDESYRPAPSKNVLVIAINNNKAKRRMWEKSYVDVFKEHGIQAVPSSKYYPDNAPEEKDIPELFSNKFDRIVLVQIVSQEEKRYHVSGSVYYEPWGFRRWYGWSYSRLRVPGYVQKERITQLETTVWEPSEDGKMIWSGITETINPGSQQQFSKDVASETIPKIIDDKILIQRKQKQTASL
jgi:hypothetical protein